MDAWIASHTGLPSLRTQGEGVIKEGTRVVGRASGDTIISDALAPPGEPVTYVFGDEIVTLTRPAMSMRYAQVTDPDGRGVKGLWYRATGDPGKWSSRAETFETGLVRWPLKKDSWTGQGKFLCWNPELIQQMQDLLTSRQPLVIATGAPIPGIKPVRAIVVKDVARSRFSPDGATEWDVTWNEHSPLEAPAPVVTWEEYSSASEGKMTAESYVEICRRIAGMPT